MREYMVRAGSLKGFHPTCESLGLSPQVMLNSVGLPTDVLEDEDRLISYTAFLKLLNLSAEMSGRVDFGVQLSQHQKLDMLGPIGFIMESSPDIATALKYLKTYFHVHNEGADLKLTASGDRAEITFLVKSDIDVSTHQQLFLSCGIGVNILRIMCGPSWNPERILCATKKPADDLSLRRYFGCPIDYDQEVNAMIFNASVLKKPISDANPQLHRILKEHLEQKIKSHSESLSHQVKNLICQLLFTDAVNIDKAAELLSTTRRRLQRQLKEEGHTFKELLDQVRFEQAKRYLQESQIPLTQLSDMLGYAEPSVFSRAFKRHTGSSPQEWREKSKMH
jgi:AraC-like DNA-binding protein